MSERMERRSIAHELDRVHDPHFSDQRRRGIMQMVQWPAGRKEPHLSLYRQLAEQDPDPTVRAAAIRALNRARDPIPSRLFIAALDDPHEQVRVEAAKALVNVPDEAAMAPLLRILAQQDQPLDVRIAAADALRHHPQMEVARALVGVLDHRRFGIAWQARQSLRALTGQDFRYEQSAWLRYLAETGRPFG